MPARPPPPRASLYCCTSHSAFGSKAIVVEGGGRLELHGSLGGAPSWTRLGQTIEPYSDIVHVSEALTAGAWQPGDQIILAPTDWYGEDHVDETEVRTISARLSTLWRLIRGAGAMPPRDHTGITAAGARPTMQPLQTVSARCV